MDVSVIIVNYNTLKLTLECIASIRQHTTDISYEIILIDNHSTDGSYERFSVMDDITYVYSDENLGFGRANNLGAKYAKGKYLLLLTSDTLLLNNAICFFYNYMESAPKTVAGVGCYLSDKKGYIIHSYGKFPTYKTLCTEIIKRKYDDKMDNEPCKEKMVDYITGADLFIRQDLFNRVHGFDPFFFMYYEETDLQYRIHSLGYFFQIISEPQILHLEGESFRSHEKTPVKKLSMQLTSRFYYMKKHNHWSVYYLFRCMYALLCTLPTMFFKSTWKNKLSYLKQLYS